MRHRLLASSSLSMPPHLSGDLSVSLGVTWCGSRGLGCEGLRADSPVICCESAADPHAATAGRRARLGGQARTAVERGTADRPGPVGGPEGGVGRVRGAGDARSGFVRVLALAPRLPQASPVTVWSSMSHERHEDEPSLPRHGACRIATGSAHLCTSPPARLAWDLGLSSVDGCFLLRHPFKGPHASRRRCLRSRSRR